MIFIMGSGVFISFILFQKPAWVRLSGGTLFILIGFYFCMVVFFLSESDIFKPPASLKSTKFTKRVIVGVSVLRALGALRG